jgi:hypothetical protein
MAGRPKRNADLDKLNNIYPKQANSIFASIEAGNSLGRIAEANCISRAALTIWLEDPARIDSFKRARTRAASTLAEQTIDIADNGIQIGQNGAPVSATGEPVESSEGRDKLRIQSRQWLAARWDRETYGEQKGPQVTINLATLHLDALRHRPAAGVSSSPASQPTIEASSYIEDTSGDEEK